jgi:hypothetical protein
VSSCLGSVANVLLEWDKVESFQAFFPHSEKFQNFIKRLAPYIAAKAIPELFSPTEGSPVPALTTPITQIVKAEASNEGAWTTLVNTIKDSTSEPPKFYRAAGVGKDNAFSLAFIGWQSLQVNCLRSLDTSQQH